MAGGFGDDLFAGHMGEQTLAESPVVADIPCCVQPVPTDKLVVTMLRAHPFRFGDQALTQSRILRAVLGSSVAKAA